MKIFMRDLLILHKFQINTKNTHFDKCGFILYLSKKFFHLGVWRKTSITKQIKMMWIVWFLWWMCFEYDLINLISVSFYPFTWASDGCMGWRKNYIWSGLSSSLRFVSLQKKIHREAFLNPFCHHFLLIIFFLCVSQLIPTLKNLPHTTYTHTTQQFRWEKS